MIESIKYVRIKYQNQELRENMIHFAKLKLKEKLLISLAFLVFIPLIILSVLFFVLTFKSEMEYTKETQMNKNQKSALYIEQIFEYSEDIYSNLMYEYYLEYFLENKISMSQYYQIAQYLDDLLTRYPYYNNFVLYGEDGIVYQRGILLENVSQNLLLKEGLKGTSVWNGPHELKLSQIYGTKEVDSISYSRVLYEYDEENIEPKGVLEINFNPQKLYQEVFEKSEKLVRDTFLIDRSGLIYLGNTEAKIGTNFKEHDKIINNMNLVDGNGHFFLWYDQQPQVCYYQLVDDQNFYIVRFLPLLDLMGSRISVLFMVFFMVLICILFGFLFSVIQKKYIIEPIFDISREIKKIEKGDFSICLEKLSNDEIGELGKSFLKMASRLEELIQENYVQKIKQQDAEINALVTQINPHFLYNTLDSLRWLALKKDEQEISDQLDALSIIFRNILNKGKSTISIGDEIKFLESYVFIMNKRYNDKVQFWIDLDEEDAEEIKEHAILKLLIQPLIENCFVHGLKYKDENGIIVLRFYIMDDDLFIEVEDNGQGIDSNMNLEKIFEEQSSQQYSALKNIYDRIKLFYGNEYGMKIEGKKEKGTCITLKLPFYK